MNSKTTPARAPDPVWGTVRSLGLDSGEVVTYFGHDRHSPARRGVKATVTRPEGKVALRSTKGRVLLAGGAATRFWACPDPDRPAPAARATTSYASPEAVRAARVPGHPGLTWLRMMRAVSLSQTEVARRMGVAPVTLNRLVRGRGIPTARITVAFARAIGADERAVWEQVCDYELDLALGLGARGAARQ